MGYFCCKKADGCRRREGNKINLIYECVGTKEENQEKIDDVFDFIFDEVIKRGSKNLPIDMYRQT